MSPQTGNRRSPDARNAAKTAFLLAGSVAAFERLGGETVDIELAAHHSVIELVSKSESGTGIFNAETRRKNWVGPQAGKA